MNATGLTPKQKQLLEFLAAYREAHGYSPSQQEIAAHFGFRSLGTVQNYLVRLKRQGLIEQAWNARRGSTPSSSAYPQLSPQLHNHTRSFGASRAEKDVSAGAVPLPLFGKVAAGFPIEALAREESVEVPPAMLRKSGRHFALQVKGDSMIDEGIFDGDYVVIRKQALAENGEIVVATLEGGATIKRIRFTGGSSHVELVPANPRYPVLTIDRKQQDFRIEGVLTGVMRLCRSPFAKSRS